MDLIPAGWRYVFAGMMVVAIFCSDTPQFRLPVAAAVAALLATAALLWIRAPRFGRDLLSAGFALFLIAIAISLPVSLWFGTPLADWLLRGAAPLLFVSVFFFLQPKTDADRGFILRVILYTSALWALWVIVQIAPLRQQLLLERWAVLHSDLFIPYNLAGIAVLLFAPHLARPGFRYSLLFVLIVLTLGGGYRSHLAIVACLLASYALYATVRGEGSRLAAVALVATAAVLPFQLTGFITRVILDQNKIAARPASPDLPSERGWLLRFAGANKDLARLTEIRYGLAQLIEAPILGKGLGHPVPSHISVIGQEKKLQELEARRGKSYPHIFMLHNFTAYIAMTMGLLGLVALAIIGIGAAAAVLRARTPETYAAFAALLALAAFSQISASYTLLQFNLLVGSLGAVLGCTHPGDGGRRPALSVEGEQNANNALPPSRQAAEDRSFG